MTLLGSHASARGALAKIRPGQLVPDMPRNAEPRTGLAMGDHAAITAKEWQIGREEQDERHEGRLGADHADHAADDRRDQRLGQGEDCHREPEQELARLRVELHEIGRERGEAERVGARAHERGGGEQQHHRHFGLSARRFRCAVERDCWSQS